MKIGVTLAYFLIWYGGMLLLRTLGFDISPSRILSKYWPFILVSLGFENLLGRRWALILGLILAGLFGLMIALLLRGFSL